MIMITHGLGCLYSIPLTIDGLAECRSHPSCRHHAGIFLETSDSKSILIIIICTHVTLDDSTLHNAHGNVCLAVDGKMSSVHIRFFFIRHPF